MPTKDDSRGALPTDARIMAFVAITDAGRARSFYRDTLGLRLVSEDGFALVFELRGTTLRASLVHSFTPCSYTVLGWEVSDIEMTARALEEAGAALERFPGLAQDKLGIWTAPGGSRVAWFKDPDGNILSVSQHPAQS